MRIDSNTILITGGGAGIGRGLAEAFHQLGNHVVVSGRNEAALQSVCAANPGMSYAMLDVADPQSIQAAAQEVTARFPALNCVVNNAGVQRPHAFSQPDGVDDAAVLAEIQTNLLGLVRMCAAFVPHLSGRPEAAIVNVTSGLAFVPLARFPIYCATKAAVHSFCLSLRHQLKGSVKVIELIPPLVDTNLGQGSRRPGGPIPMPLPEFIADAMQGLRGDADEVAVGNAKFLRATAAEAETFARMNP